MEKLLAIIGLTQKAYGRWLLQRFLRGALVVLALALVIGILVSALIVSLFYILYVVLTLNGMTVLGALLTAAGAGATFIVLMVWLTIRYMQQLHTAHASLFEKNHFGGRVVNTVGAFYDGLMKG